jgi:hypothetical protein
MARTTTILVLLLAAVLEAGGDALVRAGRLSRMVFYVALNSTHAHRADGMVRWAWRSRHALSSVRAHDAEESLFVNVFANFRFDLLDQFGVHKRVLIFDV